MPWSTSVPESLREIETRYATLEAEMRDLATARDALRALLERDKAPLDHVPGDRDPAPPPAEATPLATALPDLVASSPAGSSWKAVEFARALTDGQPSRSQIESCRQKANQLVAKGLLSKAPNGAYTKPEVVAA